MKKFYFFVLACLWLTKLTLAQDTKRNALSVELGKTGAIFNLTYDRKGETAKIGWRAFGGSNLGSSVQLFYVGGGVYYLTGKRSSHLELGTDLSYLHVDVSSEDQFRMGNLVAPTYETQTLFTSFNIGYRHYGRNSLFRIGLAPGFTSKEWLPGGYLSYGIRF